MSATLPRLEQQLERLASQFCEQRDKLVHVLQRRAAKQATELRRLNEIAELRLRQVDIVKTELNRLSASVRSHANYAGKFRKLLPPGISDRLMLLARLERIATGTRPIIIGPWTGEVGYEVLYWIPFVRWFTEQFRVDPNRLVVVSRGGPTSWYQGIASHYVDALSFFSPDEFRERTATLAWMKQDQVSILDRQILRGARQAFDGTRPALLHPSLMFRLFKGFWGGRVSLKEVMAYTSHRRLPPPEPLRGLPARYVAVRFYFRTSFPETPENRTLVARILAALTAQTDVVLLNPGFQIDDHHDFAAEVGHRLHRIDHLLTPDRNLDVQTAVIAGAEAFVGSYGGFAYLAPLLGVRSLAFYSGHTFKTCHLELAEHVFDRVGGASLTVMDTADVDLLRRVMPVAVEQRV